MRFTEYVAQSPHGEMKRIEREARVGYQTLIRAKNGIRLNEYDVAKRISDATGGKVSVAELCEAPPVVAAPIEQPSEEADGAAPLATGT